MNKLSVHTINEFHLNAIVFRIPFFFFMKIKVKEIE